jgi:hypothetical protein
MVSGGEIVVEPGGLRSRRHYPLDAIGPARAAEGTIKGKPSRNAKVHLSIRGLSPAWFTARTRERGMVIFMKLKTTPEPPKEKE